MLHRSIEQLAKVCDSSLRLLFASSYTVDTTITKHKRQRLRLLKNGRISLQSFHKSGSGHGFCMVCNFSSISFSATVCWLCNFSANVVVIKWAVLSRSSSLSTTIRSFHINLILPVSLVLVYLFKPSIGDGQFRPRPHFNYVVIFLGLW